MKKHQSIGSVKIADDVVARIAGLAATEVEGVSSMAGNITAEALAKANRKNIGKGVKVNVSGGKVTAELSLMMAYGYNIPEICEQVQSRVKSAIGNMTGLNVTSVNIRVAGITMP